MAANNLPQKQMSIPKMLEQYKDQIQAALPRHMSPDRMTRIALTEMRLNPQLASCDPLSFIGAIVQCSQLGLEPASAFGTVYLIPFNNRKRNTKEVQVIPGYKGLIELARRSGVISSISSRCVYEKDKFTYTFGLSEELIHEPYSATDRGELTHAYAVAKFKDGAYHFEVLNREEIEKIKNSTRYQNPVWDSHFDEMAKKTAIRRLCKYLPLSPEMADATTLDVQAETGRPQENYQIIDSSYEPKPFKSDEAIDMKQKLRDDSAAAVKESNDELTAQLKKQIHILKTELKQSEDSIKKYLKAENLDIEKWSPIKQEAAFEALIDFTTA